MGHEIIEYRDRHIIVHDHDLWALRHFMLLEANALRLDDFAEFIQAWEWIGPGVWLGIEFDTFFKHNAEQEGQFLELLRGTMQRIAAFGPDVPLDYLQENLNTPMEYFTTSQPSERWTSIVEKIRQLLIRPSNV